MIASFGNLTLASRVKFPKLAIMKRCLTGRASRCHRIYHYAYRLVTPGGGPVVGGRSATATLPSSSLAPASCNPRLGQQLANRRRAQLQLDYARRTRPRPLPERHQVTRRRVQEHSDNAARLPWRLELHAPKVNGRTRHARKVSNLFTSAKRVCMWRVSVLRCGLPRCTWGQVRPRYSGSRQPRRRQALSRSRRTDLA
jgi:hypothetical protein